MTKYEIPELPLKFELEDKAILKQAAKAHQQLAELKGVAQTIPNESILINTLALQEARDSSEVENIVTTQDDLFRFDPKLKDLENAPAAKEVYRYREAVRTGFASLRKGLPLTNNVIKEIQSVLTRRQDGFRTIPGTGLRDNLGGIVYLPPQDGDEILRLMANLESFINLPELVDWDPLVKLAVIHHQFESIHPFYDGNGRTGRIVCILYLIANGLQDLPILYLSRYITQNKRAYYVLLQNVRDSNGAETDWRAWVMFILKGIEETARHTISIVGGIKTLMGEYKNALRPAFGKAYKHELINHLFFHPYTKIEFMEEALQVERKTAAKYLDRIVELGMLSKVKKWRSNYYINEKLVDLLINHQELGNA